MDVLGELFEQAHSFLFLGFFKKTRNSTVVLEKGYNVVAVDSLVRGFKQPIELLQQKYGQDRLSFYQLDLRTQAHEIFEKEQGIDTVIHYAAFCNVGESEKNPEMYFVMFYLKKKCQFNIFY